MIRSLIIALTLVAAAHCASPDTLDFWPDGIDNDLLITEPPPICPPPGLEVNATTFANRYNCSTYWFCESGVPTLRACPPGLNFNAVLGVCDFPWATTCDLINPALPAKPRAKAINAACRNDGPPTCPPPGGDPSLNATVCANPFNCSTYYYCTNGLAILRSCPPTLEYHASIEVCDFKWAANCIALPPPVLEVEPVVSVNSRAGECQPDGPPICPPPGGPAGNVTVCPNPYNCSSYYYCDNGVSKPADCPPSLEFNVLLGVCDYPWNAHCVELPATTTATPALVGNMQLGVKDLECQTVGPPICPPPGGPTGNVTVCPNFLNCSMYYYCDNGASHDAACPPGLEFNAILGVCDFPWNANCVEVTTTPVAITTTAAEETIQVVNVLGVKDLECQTVGPPICPPPGGPTGNVTVCPNFLNCSMYYYCDNGAAFDAACPPGLEFNAILGVCDFPWNANCVEVTTTPSTTTEATTTPTTTLDITITTPIPTETTTAVPKLTKFKYTHLKRSHQ